MMAHGSRTPYAVPKIPRYWGLQTTYALSNKRASTFQQYFLCLSIGSSYKLTVLIKRVNINISEYNGILRLVYFITDIETFILSEAKTNDIVSISFLCRLIM